MTAPGSLFHVTAVEVRPVPGAQRKAEATVAIGDCSCGHRSVAPTAPEVELALDQHLAAVAHAGRSRAVS